MLVSESRDPLHVESNYISARGPGLLSIVTRFALK